jgi:hypothetical protein
MSQQSRTPLQKGVLVTWGGGGQLALTANIPFTVCYTPLHDDIRFQGINGKYKYKIKIYKNKE